ncbi:MAG: DUF523 and DUF1722 domain-containing protein [Desulfohalobiaceae bacterium]|nr:DUF523 and DUF1722 domain-containing protein [Desulfohalobiaceae bacterium]
MEKITLGMSSCLLGHPVRYDGGHKLDRYVRDTLGHYFEYVPVCPEVECGMPVPRESLRLVGDPQAPRLRTRTSQQDFTEQMQAWGRRKLEELAEADPCGYIFKSRSPSSGMERIKVYNDQGNPGGTGVGIWARMVMERFPFLPVEDEGRLHDPGLREQFIEHVFVFWRWRQLEKQGPDIGALTDFHARHKLLLMAHSPELYREMGRYVAHAKSYSREDLLPGYLRLLDRAMRTPATVAKHVNVLHHILGYFKQELSPDEKQEFLDIAERFRQGSLPLIVPVTLLNHFVRKYKEPYLGEQIYLNPHPVELKLRNHA